MGDPLVEQPPANADQLLNAIRLLLAGSIPGVGPLTEAQLRATPLQVVDSTSNPAANAGAVVPSDVTTLPACRALFVGGEGSLVVTMSGVDVTFANVPEGTWMPIMATKVKAATTATNIVRVW